MDLRLKFKIDNKKVRDFVRDQLMFSARSDADKAAFVACCEHETMLARMLDRFNSTFAERTCARFGAVCFTTGGDANTRFWYEYAGKHSGVCIHWDARTQPLSHALKVNYSDDAHEVELPDSGPLQFIELMLRKRLCYSWEKEYRLLYLPGRFEPVLVADDRQTQIHPGGIVGITFGADVRPDYRMQFLMCIASMIDPMVDDPNIPRIFRADIPPLYQAELDTAGVVTVKPFRFDYVTGNCVFDS